LIVGVANEQERRAVDARMRSWVMLSYPMMNVCGLDDVVTIATVCPVMRCDIVG